MSSTLASWAPDGVDFVVHPWFVGALGRSDTNTVRRPGIFYDEQAGLIVLGDVRLDNAADLVRALGLLPGALDAEILARGYRRWGRALVEKLAGDFAVVIADTAARRVTAFRDEFGLRPLVHASSEKGLLLASDEDAILAVSPQIREVDSSAVVEYLLRSFSRPQATFWRDIRSVSPQYIFSADQNGWSESFHPRPPPRPRQFVSKVEFLSEFRTTFTESVRARLDNDVPTLLHLSGGLDSSVINLVADSLLKQGRVSCPDRRAVSAVFPGLSCDETDTIGLTAERLSFPHESWDGRLASVLDFFDPSLGGPGRRVGFSGGCDGDIPIAQRSGARVILTGNGGELFSPSGEALVDRLVAGDLPRFVQAVYEGRGIHWQKRLKQILGDVGLGWTLPRAVRRRRLPDWLSPDGKDIALDLPGLNQRSIFESPFLNRQWAFAHSPRLTRGLATFYRPRAVAGISVTCPFLDARLVDLVFSASPELWPSPGYPARFHADAFADIIPERLLAKNKVGFGSAVQTLLVRPEVLGRIQELVRSAGSPASCLSQEYAASQLYSLMGKGAGANDRMWIDMYLVATLLAWLGRTMQRP